jgi:hypothetical protein
MVSGFLKIMVVIVEKFFTVAAGKKLPFPKLISKTYQMSNENVERWEESWPWI